jgi:hypothetical protein
LKPSPGAELGKRVEQRRGVHRSRTEAPPLIALEPPAVRVVTGAA